MQQWALSGSPGKYLDLLNVYFEIILSLLLDVDLLIHIHMYCLGWVFFTKKIAYYTLMFSAPPNWEILVNNLKDYKKSDQI